MIFETLIFFFTSSITMIFNVLPSLPAFPIELSNSIDSYLVGLFKNLDLLNFFIPLDTLKVAIPLAILIINFDKIYFFLRWIIKKIPVNVE